MPALKPTSHNSLTSSITCNNTNVGMEYMSVYVRNVTVVAVKVFAKNVHYHFIGNTNNMEMKVSDIPSQYQAIMKSKNTI